MIRRYRMAGLASAMLLFSILSLSFSRGEAPADKDPDINTPSPAQAGLLNQLNTASEQTLKGKLGIPEAVVSKIMAHRATGAKFTSLIEVRSVTKMTYPELQRLLAPFTDMEEERAYEAKRKPVPDPATPGKAGGKLKQGGETAGKEKETEAAPEPAVTATGTGPITAIRPGFYGKLPGYEDLDKVDPVKRTEFLETVNREFCTCGCKNETIAFCLVNDPSCPVVKSRAKKIYDDIMNKPPR